MNQIIKKVKSICLSATVVVIVLSNTVNYFYCYKHLEDHYLQWKVAMLSIGFTMFTMSVYIWLTEHERRNKKNILISGWTALFLLISFIGVVMGYTLHTKGFMMILFAVILGGGAHITTRQWQK